MDANDLEAGETVPASRKLGKKEAAAMLRQSKTLLVAKGKKVREFQTNGKAPAEAVEAMLGPTGNLRAPTMRVGSTVLVGFNEEMFEEFFSG